MPYEDCGQGVSRGLPARDSRGEAESQHLRAAGDGGIVRGEGPIVRERAHADSTSPALMPCQLRFVTTASSTAPSLPTETFTEISPLRSGL